MAIFHKSQTPVHKTFENLPISVLNQNILYLTHEIDQIKVIVQKIHNTINLKYQADKYFGDTYQGEELPQKTSHQTELDEHE